MGHLSALLLLSVLHHCLQFGSYTADLYLILLSDHNNTFSKYTVYKIVTGYNFRSKHYVQVFFFLMEVRSADGH